MNSSFVYRLATAKDVEQIVALFELCLGTAGGAPTVEFWNWKHHQNPAGTSPVILAWDQDKLIGIRAFMCFKFQATTEIYKAYRPVDTATHPDYQGKGIFKNLTLQLISDLQKINEQAFIFNTPNSQSKPGYLKMGWIEWGKPKLQVYPVFNVFADGFIKNQNRLQKFDFSEISADIKANFTVVKDARYYQWRYQQIPLQHYGLKEIQLGNDRYVIVYRQKKIKFLKEFRICEVIKNNQSTTEIPATLLVKLFWSFGIGFVSFINKKQFLLTVNLNKKAPMVTYKKINADDNNLEFSQVDWSIGELELF